MRSTITSVAEARQIAQRRLPRLAFDFVDGGAEDEVTLRANLAAFERVTLRPHPLVDVSKRDLTTTLFGTRIRMPILIGPTGLSRLAGGEGELAGARAAARARTIFTLSSMGSQSIEDVAGTDARPLWFQLYLWRQRDLVESFVERAADAGFEALVVTLDVPVAGNRERDVRNGFTIPPRANARNVVDLLRHPGWFARGLRPPIAFRNLEGSESADPRQTVAHARYIDESLSNPGATYEDLDRIRALWKGALLVKGVLTGEDAVRAVEHGVDGIIVSNHGGRQLDGAPASLDALDEVAGAVAGRAVVLFDGGVRRGSDVAKALALGAQACLIGRPWLYGLAAGGEDGVLAVLEVLREELDRTLVLTGRRRLADLDRSAVGCPSMVRDRGARGLARPGVSRRRLPTTGA